ncbi:MAG TPA: hypothetical protein VH186_03940 [Chloroflexia bacterium]|nr:hypothetical protein [Chloroflexia bacterium]
MFLDILFSGLVLLTGLVAGRIIGVTAENIAVISLSNPDDKKGLNQRLKKVRWIWIVTGLITLITWLQAPYQNTPFYLFATNILLVWFLMLIALVDWLSHLVFPKMVLAGVMLIGVILLVVSFLNTPVGIMIDKATGLTKAINNQNSQVITATFSQLWPLNLYDSLAGAVLSGLLFGLLYGITRLVIRKEVIGSGDVLLAIFVGLTLGLWRTISALGITVGLSLIVSSMLLLLNRQAFTRNRLIAYGPFLCAGAIYCLMFGSIFTPG